MKIIIDFFAGDLNGNQFNHDCKQFGKYRQLANKGKFLLSVGEPSVENISEVNYSEDEFKIIVGEERDLSLLIDYAIKNLEATRSLDYISFVGIRSIDGKPNTEIKPYINPMSREISDGENWKYLADSLMEAGYNVVTDRKKNILSAFFNEEPKKFVEESKNFVEESKNFIEEPIKEGFDIPKLSE